MIESLQLSSSANYTDQSLRYAIYLKFIWPMYFTKISADICDT